MVSLTVHRSSELQKKKVTFAGAGMRDQYSVPRYRIELCHPLGPIVRTPRMADDPCNGDTILLSLVSVHVVYTVLASDTLLALNSGGHTLSLRSGTNR